MVSTIKKDSLQCVYYLHQQQLLTLLMQLIILKPKGTMGYGYQQYLNKHPEKVQIKKQQLVLMTFNLKLELHKMVNVF